jgi:TolB-like protein
MADSSQPADDNIPTSDVRAQMARILAFEEFQRSTRLSDFLTFVVEKTLSGDDADIKGYTIAIEVFGKPESFDPETDASVRVDATRLRRALANYYAGPGAGDPLFIDIPRGQYRPVFRLNAAEADVSSKDAPTRGGGSSQPTSPVPATASAHHRIVWAIAIALVAIIAVPAVTQIGALFETSGPNETAEVALPTGKHGPRIAMVPLINLSNKGEYDFLSYGLSVDLVTELSRFDWLTVFVGSAIYDARYPTIAKVQDRPKNVDYVLSGAIRADENTFVVTVSLFSEKSNAVLWSDVFREELTAKSLIDVQQRIAKKIAVEIARPEGLVAKLETRKVLRDTTSSLSAYACVLQLYQYWRSYAAVEHARVRSCLENAVKTDPDYAEAHAALAFIYLDEKRYGINRRSGYDPLERARKEVATAHQLNSFSSLTSLAMLALYGELKDGDGLRRVGLAAIRQSPNNPSVLAHYGWRLAMDIGAWKEGIDLVKRAMVLNPDPPAWYFIPQGYDAYRSAHYDEALTWSDRMNLPDFFLYHMLRVACFLRLGDTEHMQAQLDALGSVGYDDAKQVLALLKGRSNKDNMWDNLRRDIEKAFHRNLRS